MGRSVLHISQILEWADAHRARTGRWPVPKSGHIFGTTDEKWRNVDAALQTGVRGLPGGSSLARLFAQYRGRRNQMALPRLSLGQILKWADAHHARTGEWPGVTSGGITGTTNEKWKNIDAALRDGVRGLPGG